MPHVTNNATTQHHLTFVTVIASSAIIWLLIGMHPQTHSRVCLSSMAEFAVTERPHQKALPA